MDTVVDTGTRGQVPLSGQIAFSQTGEVLRDIARGGIAGAIAGIVVAGLGGRLMR